MGLKPANERIAVIAVHGVADQRPGDTARSVAELLVAGAADVADVEYVLHSSEELALHVAPLPPSPQAGGLAATGSLRRAFAQSHRSDFHRSHWVAAGGPAPPGPALDDPGIALSDFLLFKAHCNGTPDEAYGTTRLDLQRVQHASASAPAQTQDVHVYEMYWADLSRLSGALPRIVTEMFTMVFRLSQLGRDTVQTAARQFSNAARPSARWRWLSRSQTLLDWAFAKVLALLTLQLLMIALIFVPMGLAAHADGFMQAAHRVALVILPLAALLGYLYRFQKTWWGVLAAAAVIAGLGAAVWAAPPHWVLGLLWLGLLSLGYDSLMKTCEARFPFTRVAGWALWGAVMGCAVLTAALSTQAPLDTLNDPASLHVWVVGALRALEFVLLAMVAWWGFAGLALSFWLIAGQAASWTHGFEGRGSVATGRITLFVSLGSFVILTMASWAALSGLLNLSVPDTRYLPLIFDTEPLLSAQHFLDERYRRSTETFSLVAPLLLLLFVHVLLSFVPSLLAEARIGTGPPARLGRWLTVGYRSLDFSVAVLAALGVITALGVGTLLVAGRVNPDWLVLLNREAGWIPELSQRILKPLIFSAASAMVALSVLGGLLSRYLPGLRAPLDAALDVDNHFREFPRQGIPRARIFARYAALLRHVHRQGYERIVIVSHSQGTVISAELLRYLRHSAERLPAGPGTDDPAAELGRDLAGKLHLLTAGCPLRQLYASRFPSLYRWVLQEQYGRLGPAAAGLGVQNWVNVYTTGDYVGRWLWSRPAREPGDVDEPWIDQVVSRDDVYRQAGTDAGAELMPAGWREWDVCLGSGAHTHYFESGQLVVARLIDRLIANRASVKATVGN